MADLVEDFGAALHGRCTVERGLASGAMTRASVAVDRRRDYELALEVSSRALRRRVERRAARAGGPARGSASAGNAVE